MSFTIVIFFCHADLFTKKYSEAEMETWENPVSLGSKESTSSSMGRVCATLSYSTGCYRRLHSLQLFLFF